jgi:hypothetical protein
MYSKTRLCGLPCRLSEDSVEVSETSLKDIFGHPGKPDRYDLHMKRSFYAFYSKNAYIIPKLTKVVKSSYIKLCAEWHKQNWSVENNWTLPSKQSSIKYNGNQCVR